MDKDRQLNALREKIDQIDQKMRALFEARLDVASAIADYKKEHNLPVLDASREQWILDQSVSKLQNPHYKESYLDFMKSIMRICREYQNNLLAAKRVGFQGADGAFSHIVLKEVFGAVEEIAYPTFGEVFRAVADGEIACGILPLENSYTGEVGEVLDLLFQYDVSIQSVHDYQIRQNLLGIEGATIADIRKVYSHPQAIAQCETFLQAHAFEVIPYPNTALAAKLVQEKNDPAIGAIASEKTAALYTLRVLAQNINTRSDNTTRFIVITKEKPDTTKPRFSIMLSVKHEVGQLSKTVQVFEKYGINLLNIKSRPLKGTPWEYYFFLEGEGGLTPKEREHFLEELKAYSTKLKDLGSYIVEKKG